MYSIEIKPEAPWIRRSDQGVIFTDEVIKYDIELSQSSESDKSEEEEEEDEDHEGYVNNAEDLFEEGDRYRRDDLSDERYGHHEEE